MALFAEHGFHAATVRTIAETAGVSPGLVIHHYGSKENLRAACDERVLALARTRWDEMEAVPRGGGAELPRLGAILDEELRALRYLSRALTEASASTDALVDDLLRMTMRGQQEMVDAGAMSETDEPLLRAVLFLVWDLAPLVLADHVRRLSGVDPFSPDGLTRLLRVATTFFAPSLFGSAAQADDKPTPHPAPTEDDHARQAQPDRPDRRDPGARPHQDLRGG